MSKKEQKNKKNISTELENYIGVDKTISEVNINSASLAELYSYLTSALLAQKLLDTEMLMALLKM